MSFSEFTIALALTGAPVNGDAALTIVNLHSDAVTADIQKTRLPVKQAIVAGPLAPAPFVSLAANEQIFGSLAAVSAQTEPPVSLEPLAVEPPVVYEPLLPTDPAPVPEPDQAESNEIIVTARPRAPKSDPLQDVNAESFEVIQNVDEAVVAPIALAYQDTLPSPVRSGLSNFLSNLGEPVVFLNYLLQLKPGKAIETLGRFTINSTIGLAGLVDVAKKPPFNLPKRENGFANTLGYYGVEPGAFLFLPLIGPTTVRDIFGRVVDLSVLPFAVGKPFNQLVYTVPSGVITSLDSRIALDDQIRELRDSNDPYAATRELYLQQRQAEIDALRGKSSAKIDPASKLSDPTSSAPESKTITPSSGISSATTGSSDNLVLEKSPGPVPSGDVDPSDSTLLRVPD